MALLAVERIKLFSTRSPWWCLVLALGLTSGYAGMLAAYSDGPVTVPMTQSGAQLGLMVVMVMAALAITTEYRFGTIRASFQAMPNRFAVLLAKAAVVTGLALVLGLLVAFSSLAVSAVVSTDSQLALTTAEQWRQVAGVGAVFAVAAIMALAVGTLVRQTAGAVTILLVWSMMVESLVALIPEIGTTIQEWLPFTALDRFLGRAAPDAVLGPWGSLCYVLGVAVALWIVAAVVAHRRDA
ncbi:hypothetical protein GIY23_22065 [Allosaccharopolyspora coralli]|uniref:ABC transporter permease n=1 Tax=Allosaccharopolyspora coralli TaxID=2665642 RepID=A0A5Q3QJX0_9PSEU|nr:hypothetical protein GIY23_22065 [Allosaccharopolyspora coralli]